MIFKPLKKKKKFGLNQTSTLSQSPTVKEHICTFFSINASLDLVLWSVLYNVIYIYSNKQ